MASEQPAPMSSYTAPSLAEITTEMEGLEDWDERYELLVDLGRQLPPLPPELQTEANRVHGCMSTVWLAVTVSDEQPRRLRIAADSDSLIVRGLIVLVLALFDRQPVAAVGAIDAGSVFQKLGLAQHLSPNRRNGLFAMVRRVQELAARAQ